MDRQMEGGAIVEEIRELRKVMVEMVLVLRRLVRGIERREEIGRESMGVEVRTEREGAREESKVKGVKRKREKEERKVGRWRSQGKWDDREVENSRGEEGDEREDGGRKESWRWREGASGVRGRTTEEE